MVDMTRYVCIFPVWLFAKAHFSNSNPDHVFNLGIRITPDGFVPHSEISLFALSQWPNRNEKWIIVRKFYA